MLWIHSFKRIATQRENTPGCLWSTWGYTITARSVFSPLLKSPSFHLSPDGKIQCFVFASGKPGCELFWILTHKAQHCRQHLRTAGTMCFMLCPRVKGPWCPQGCSPVPWHVLSLAPKPSIYSCLIEALLLQTSRLHVDHFSRSC